MLFSSSRGTASACLASLQARATAARSQVEEVQEALSAQQQEHTEAERAHQAAQQERMRWARAELWGRGANCIAHWEFPHLLFDVCCCIILAQDPSCL